MVMDVIVCEKSNLQLMIKNLLHRTDMRMMIAQSLINGQVYLFKYS